MKLPESKHKAWMNGMRFKQNGWIFEIIEGKFDYIKGEFVSVIKFGDVDTKVSYTMSEDEFFYKVDGIL